MKTKDVLHWTGLVVLAHTSGKFLGKVEALSEVLNEGELDVESLTVKLTKCANLTVFKKHADKEGA